MENKLNISLVVIAGRDAVNLERLIKTVKALKEKPVELIIVFDMKQCKKASVIKIEGVNVKHIEYYGEGKQPHMRNLALSATECDYLWYIDDDVSLDVSSYVNLHSIIEDIPENSMVGSIAGKIIEDKGFDRNKIKRPIEFNFLKGPIGLFDFNPEEFPNHLYDVVEGISGSEYPVVDFCQGTSMVFKRGSLCSIGGFDEDLGVGYSSFEDSEPSFALKRKGLKTIYCGGFALTHHKLPRIGGVSRGNQQFDYNKYLVNNCVISLFKNDFPSSLLKIPYVLSFTIVQLGRCIKENIKSEDKSTVHVILKSLQSVSSGFYQGAKTSYKSNYERVNSSK